MESFRADIGALTDIGSRFNSELREEQRSIADQVQGAGQVQPNVGDVAAAAGLQQSWYDWVQTRFEDLQATDDVLTGIGKAFAETATAYERSDNDTAAHLERIGDQLGGGVR